MLNTYANSKGSDQPDQSIAVRVVSLEPWSISVQAQNNACSESSRIPIFGGQLFYAQVGAVRLGIVAYHYVF